MNAEAFPALNRKTEAERRQHGVELRRAHARSDQADWSPPLHRRDPMDVLQEQGANRILALLPLRYARMQSSAFTFLRGAAAVMAEDLGRMPATGLRVQACGDCHLANFGAYASPEGLPVFDVNDFDETLPAPFEWDLKRLATSLVVAGREKGGSDSACEDLARSASQAYRRTMERLAGLPPIDAWSTRIDLGAALAKIHKARVKASETKRLMATLKSGKSSFNLIEHSNGVWRIREKPPTVYHFAAHELATRAAFEGYAATLAPGRRILLDHYRLRDVAFKVVGVGSVGTFCAIGLFTDADGNPLILQLKEAQESVLARHAGPSAFANQGQRVVVGQRLLQATSDIFLGWTQPPDDPRHFYVRQLKDSRLAAVGESIESALPFYAELCGRTLARGHARSGDAAAIAGYAGEGRVLDNAIAGFAMAYADQTRRDWERFCAAIDAGHIEAKA